MEVAVEVAAPGARGISRRRDIGMEFWPAAVKLRGFNREEKRREMEMHEATRGRKAVLSGGGR